MIVQKIIGNKRNKICAICHLRGPKSPGIIVCSGIANTMSEPRYLFSILSKQLYELGFNVFQFDYSGDGDSEGNFTDITLESLISSSREVKNYCKSLSIKEVGIIGYGIGNVIASFLIEDCSVKTAVLISPYFRIFNNEAQESWKELKRVSTGKVIFPRHDYTSLFLKMFWQATVGENITPSQPCGPINKKLCDELKFASPVNNFLKSKKPFLVISNDEKDELTQLKDYGKFKLLKHEPSKHKPSWQWCLDCRKYLMSNVLKWFGEFLPVENKIVQKNNIFANNDLRDEHSEEKYKPSNRERILSVSIKNEHTSMLGILHVPSQSSKLKTDCVIFEPGIPGQRVDIHRCGTRLANELVKEGYYVFRYDARGMGVSEGKFHKVTITRKLEDFMLVMNFLSGNKCMQVKNFIIVSNSAGARLAVLIANRMENVRACVFWGPVLTEPENRVGEGVIKRHLDGSFITEYCGLCLGINYNLDERKYDFVEEFLNMSQPALLVLSDEDKDGITYKKIQPINGKSSKVKMISKPGQHGFDPKDVDGVIADTIKWIYDLNG